MPVSAGLAAPPRGVSAAMGIGSGGTQRQKFFSRNAPASLRRRSRGASAARRAPTAGGCQTRGEPEGASADRFPQAGGLWRRHGCHAQAPFAPLPPFEILFLLLPKLRTCFWRRAEEMSSPHSPAVAPFPRPTPPPPMGRADRPTPPHAPPTGNDQGDVPGGLSPVRPSHRPLAGEGPWMDIAVT